MLKLVLPDGSVSRFEGSLDDFTNAEGWLPVTTDDFHEEDRTSFLIKSGAVMKIQVVR